MQRIFKAEWEKDVKELFELFDKKVARISQCDQYVDQYLIGNAIIHWGDSIQQNVAIKIDWGSLTEIKRPKK